VPLEAEAELVRGRGGSGRLLLGTQFTFFTTPQLRNLFALLHLDCQCLRRRRRTQFTYCFCYKSRNADADPLPVPLEQVGGRGVSGLLLLGMQFTYFTSTKVQMLTQKRLLVVGWGVLELWTVVEGVEGGGGAGGLADAAACLEAAEVGVRLEPVRRRQV
jgi:hypothetical protein